MGAAAGLAVAEFCDCVFPPWDCEKRFTKAFVPSPIGAIVLKEEARVAGAHCVPLGDGGRGTNGFLLWDVCLWL